MPALRPFRVPGSVKVPVMTLMNNPSLVGTHVGNVRLESRLGSGGMGEVYLGYDARLERRVAVKTIRAEHRFEPEMKTRFLREARILSKLEHPAICQVYDLVEGERADFLIFEFVEGRTLKQVMAAGKLDTTRALEIGEKIAQALAAAHRERIVHRDLKPENIMVTEAGEIKILDFGISRAVKEGARPGPALASPPAPARQRRPGELSTGAPLASTVWVETPTARAAAPTVYADATTAASPDELESGATRLLPGSGTATSITLDADLTQRGYVVGTVRYMSPEQARAEEVAEPSDLYSFGILLQEMLTGKAAYAGGLSPSEMVMEVAAAKTLAPTGLDAELIAFLERLKSAAPPARPTAVEAAERLRFLLEKPERQRRQRLRLALAAGAFVFLTVVLVVVSVLAVRANREAERANREAERANSEAQRAGLEAVRANSEADNARQVVAFVVALFREAGPDESHGRALTALEMVDRGAAQVSSGFAERPLARARFQHAIGKLYWQLGNFGAAEKQLSAAIAALEQNPTGEVLELATSRAALANVFADQGDFDRAALLFGQAIEAYQKLAPRSPDLASMLGDFGALRWRQGDLPAALPMLERALAIDQEVFGASAPELAERRNNLAILTWQLGDLPRAQELFERALASKEKLEGADHPDVVALLNNLGILLREQGEAREAEALHRRALEIGARVLGPRHPDLASVWFSLGRALAVLERRREAIAAFEAAIDIHRRSRGESFFEIGRALVFIADLERQDGDFAAAASHLEKARQVLERSVGSDHPAMNECREALARLAKDRAAARPAPPPAAGSPLPPLPPSAPPAHPPWKQRL